MLKPRGSSMGAAATRAWGVVMLFVLILGLTYMSEEARIAQAKEEVIEATNKRAHVESSFAEKFKKMQREVQELNDKIKGSKEDCKTSIATEKQRNDRLSDELNRKSTNQESSQIELDRLTTSEHTLENALRSLQEKHDALLQQKVDLETEVARITETQADLTIALQTCTAKFKAHESTVQDTKAKAVDLKSDLVTKPAKVAVTDESKESDTDDSLSNAKDGSDVAQDKVVDDSEAHKGKEVASDAKSAKEDSATDSENEAGSEGSQGAVQEAKGRLEDQAETKEGIKDEEKGSDKEEVRGEGGDSNESDA